LLYALALFFFLFFFLFFAGAAKAISPSLLLRTKNTRQAGNPPTQAGPILLPPPYFCRGSKNKNEKSVRKEATGNSRITVGWAGWAAFPGESGAIFHSIPAGVLPSRRSFRGHALSDSPVPLLLAVAIGQKATRGEKIGKGWLAGWGAKGAGQNAEKLIDARMEIDSTDKIHDHTRKRKTGGS